MKLTATSRMNRVNRQFARHVRRECEAIARSGERESYHDFASRIGHDYRVHHKIIDAALTYNMTEDVKAGRPFASAAVAQGGGNGIPGHGFLIAAWELGRFLSGDEREFAEGEWQAFCELCSGQLVAA